MVYGSNFDIRFLSRHLTDKPRRRYNTTYKASRAAFSPSLIFILMSETSSRVEKEDNSNKNKTCSSWKKLSSSVKKHHRKLASYNGYGVVVILSGSYHAFCILCVLSILCTHRV